MIFLSPAKINLCLEITGTDPKDGYHYIKSVFDPVSLFDILDITALNSGRIELEDMNSALPGLPAEKNIIYKAAAAMKKRFGCRKGARIKFYKFIPDGGGLGGGSSNAATVLKALNKLWGLNRRKGELKKIGFSLGADVPFFIDSRRALVEGKGEKIRAVSGKKKLWYVLAAGKERVPTKDAYRWADEEKNKNEKKQYCEKILSVLEGNKMLEKGSFILYNDFIKAVLKRKSGIVALLRQLKSHSRGFCSMSGSGATVFSVFETKKEAHKCYLKMKAGNKGIFTALVHSL